ncbi:Hypothetical_protein [Hexamita inflata]|uniref:Hypothetical_protein n=1 Tax=Hexamita inflata TaxID=28002 RepID=A0AA86RDE3_9EUKA|nr:Hypothetical protein HINF_LOCUS58658 [Hexamita inflata]
MYDGQNEQKRQLAQNRKQLENNWTKKDFNATEPQEIVNPPPAIYSEIRDLQKQINQHGTQEPNQVNEPMHQRQPPPSNANTTEQPLVQAEGNNEQRETEKRELFTEWAQMTG